MPIAWDKVGRTPPVAKEFDIDDSKTGAFKINLRKLDGAEEAKRDQEIDRLASKYIFGNWRGEDGVLRKQPSLYPDIDDAPVATSYELFAEAVEISMMLQAPGELMTVDEVIRASVCLDQGWHMIRGAYFMVKNGAVDESGEDSPGG